jgi:hypothetical protein
MPIEKIEFEFPDAEEDELVEVEVEPSSLLELGEELVEVEEPEKELEEIVEDDIDIEIVDDTPLEDQNRVASEPPDEVTDAELEGYSEKVRKRIQRFTKGYHDERRAKEVEQRRSQELENYARTVMAENDELKVSQGQNRAAILEQAKRAVGTELASAQKAYLEAHETGDSQAMLDAQEKLTSAKIRGEKINNIKLPSLQENKDAVQREQRAETTYQESAQPAPQVDAAATEWADENKWFGTDEEMTGFALVVHNKLVKSGVNPQTKNYYEKINSRMREVFPENFEEEGVPPKRKKSQIVAPATRSTAPKSVKLTKTQVALAKKLGVPLKEYAIQAAIELRKDNG